MRSTARGTLRHLVTLEIAGPPTPDGDGGYTQTWTPLDPPSAYAEIATATVRGLERVASTVIATASHIVTMDYHPGMRKEARIVFNDHVLNVLYVGNPAQRDIETICVCSEVLE